MKTKLTVKYFDGTDYTDISSEAASYKRDTFDFTLLSGQYIYVGFEKQINALYAHFEALNLNPANLTAEYYNGAWTEFDLDDCTAGFQRNGFLHWDRVEDGQNVSVDGMEMCWWRFSLDTDSTVLMLQGLNILFSDDDCICVEASALIDPCFYRDGASSHVLYHVSARDKIMNDLKRLGYANHEGQSIDEWDILEIEEFKQASTYYAIAQIYFNLSDSPDDQYWNKYREYMARYNEAFSLSRIQIDQNDDGVAQTSEIGPKKTVRWVR